MIALIIVFYVALALGYILGHRLSGWSWESGFEAGFEAGAVAERLRNPEPAGLSTLPKEETTA